MEQVRLTSKGIGISTDGWQSIRAAITARGVVAEQVIGQLGNFVSMLIGNGEDIVQINDKGIAAGASSFNTAPLRVNMKGDVIANSLTANYANIQYSNFKDGAIVGSSINVGNGMFTVTSGGIMSAVGANSQGRLLLPQLPVQILQEGRSQERYFGQQRQVDVWSKMQADSERMTLIIETG